MAGLLQTSTFPLLAEDPAGPAAAQIAHDPSRPAPVCMPSQLDSPYIPVDSWIYPAVFRLYSLGFVDTIYLGMRPWTRASVENMLEVVGGRIQDADDNPATDEATGIYEALQRELLYDMNGPCLRHQGNSRIESVYTTSRIISGTPLRDSYHLGSTIINDYGRPFANGFNNYSGASGSIGAGHFQLYARGEFQGSPATTGYSQALAQALAALDGTTDFFNTTTPIPYNQQATIPAGPINSVASGRLMEAYASAHYWNHEISIRQAGRLAWARRRRRHGLLQ